MLDAEKRLNAMISRIFSVNHINYFPNFSKYLNELSNKKQFVKIFFKDLEFIFKMIQHNGFLNHSVDSTVFVFFVSNVITYY